MEFGLVLGARGLLHFGIAGSHVFQPTLTIKALKVRCCLMEAMEQPSFALIFAFGRYLALLLTETFTLPAKVFEWCSD
jgi:hypothetical protein